LSARLTASRYSAFPRVPARDPFAVSADADKPGTKAAVASMAASARAR